MSVLAKTDSEVSSLTGQSSPSRSPSRGGSSGVRHVYYVQSPSRDSHDGEKTTNSFHSSPAVLSPMGSPPQSSRDSSSTRFSGSAASRAKHGGSARSGPHARGGAKGWRAPPWKGNNIHNHNNDNNNNNNYFDAIEEEGLIGDVDGPYTIGQARRCYVLVFVIGFLCLFSLFSLILWGASRPQKPTIAMKSILFDQFVVQAGTDFSGVATELVSMNSTVKLSFHNTATFFGVHVTSTPLDLSYSQLTVATGTMRKFYQSRKSHRSIAVILRGRNIPLYGGGSSLESVNGAPVQPVELTLRFMVRSRAYVLGKLVKPKFYRKITCLVTMDPNKMNASISLKNKCSYE